MHARRGQPAMSGTLLAVLGAIAFGATAPFVKRLGVGVGPFTTAGLLYGGAALASLARRGGAEAPVRAAHAPRLVAVALVGAVLAPVLLAWGLQRTTAVTASLVLNLEAVFTVLLARAVHREPIGTRVAVAMTAMLAGGVILVLSGHAGGVLPTLGLVAVAGATLGWAIDNTLTRPLAELDPRAVVRWKGTLGATLSFALGLAWSEPRPALLAAAGLLACGATGYGASLQLYLRAQRLIGVGRAGSVFAVAPFVGVAVAVALGETPAVGPTAAAAILFAVGVYLHATEAHGHRHRHASLEHEHAHRHDDGHHAHSHEQPAAGEHSHPHRHDEAEHEHPHGQDVHHRHEH